MKNMKNMKNIKNIKKVQISDRECSVRSKRYDAAVSCHDDRGNGSLC